MPKQKITKEMVVDAAFALARKHGMEQVMVKNIADALGCSVQPIYSYCSNMEGLRNDVMDKVIEYVQAFVMSHIDTQDLFRSSGQAYIQFAKAEPHLYKMFVLHQRKNVASLDDLYRKETNPDMAVFIAEHLQIDIALAKQLHLHMLIYTIGLGTIFSVTSPGISTDEIFSQQEMAYQAFVQHIQEKKK